METKRAPKSGLAAIYSLCPLGHCLALLSGAVILLHLLTRGDHALMERLSERLIRPMHRSLASLTAYLPFSLAELIITLMVLGNLLYIGRGLLLFLRKKGDRATAYRMLITPLTSVLTIYALFCAMWGPFFYGDDFTTRSGLSETPVSVEELAAVTEYFADLANEYSGLVSRDEQGICSVDRQAVLSRSSNIFDAVEESFPSLAGPDVEAKPIFFSRITSYLDFTGFFFPITGEANVNMDFPPSLFASTVAHEISHQRGVAREEEANFVAVLASLESGDADYVYSAALLAYTHLGNALNEADYDVWLEIYHSLDDFVLMDFAQNRGYWQQFESPVQTVSNTVYEGFLHSYDQHLGLKSYGACVDLLVNYYYDTVKN